MNFTFLQNNPRSTGTVYLPYAKNLTTLQFIYGTTADIDIRRRMVKKPEKYTLKNENANF